MDPEFNGIPVIEPGAAQRLVVEGEAERLDEMDAVPVAAHSRAMLPVLGGICGSTSATWSPMGNDGM